MNSRLPQKNAPLSYRERIRLDAFLARPEFGIKTFGQFLFSCFSFFKAPRDRVSKKFLTKKLNDVYETVEQLIIKTQMLFSKRDSVLCNNLKGYSPFAYNVLVTTQRWNLEKISSEIARLEARAASIEIKDLKSLIWLLYRPLMALNLVLADSHIPFVLEKLYLALSIGESDIIIRDERKNTTREIVNAYNKLYFEIRRSLYPILLKLIGAEPCSEETFFTQYKNEILEFLAIKESNIIKPPDIKDNKESANECGAENIAEEGLDMLSLLFPESRWDTPWDFPDFYQYFVRIYEFPVGFARIAPENPVFQILILAHVLKDLFCGFNDIKFLTNRKTQKLCGIIYNWNNTIEDIFFTAYLKPLAEYFDYYSIPKELRNKEIGDKLFFQLCFLQKMTLFPFSDFNFSHSVNERPEEYVKLYRIVESLYNTLYEINLNIKNKDKRLILNPEAQFVFDAPNNISRRLYSLINRKDCTNALLIEITLEITGVMHYLMNNENSWAYNTNIKKVFRSSDAEGIIPEKWIDQKLNPVEIFLSASEDTKKRADEKFERILSVTINHKEKL